MFSFKQVKWASDGSLGILTWWVVDLFLGPDQGALKLHGPEKDKSVSPYPVDVKLWAASLYVGPNKRALKKRGLVLDPWAVILVCVAHSA